MTINAFRKKVKTIMAFAGLLAAVFVLFQVSRLMAQGKTVPDHGGFNDCQVCHAEKYKMWEKSGHSRASKIVAGAAPVGADCLGCHTAEGFAAKLQGGTVDPANRESFNTISCMVCHKPGSSANSKQLVLNSEKLCNECHTQIRVLHGKEAEGIEATKGFHSDVACVSCHMPETNHEMKFIRPENPGTTKDNRDTCMRCHNDNNREARAKQLTEWQALYKEAMDSVQAGLAVISAGIKEKPDLFNADQNAKLSAVRANLFILQQDASRGAHNIDFALKIMAKALKDIKELEAAIK